LRELYAWTSARIFETSVRVAEMVKYASNMAEVVVIGNRAPKKKTIQAHLCPNKRVVELVNLEKDHRPGGPPTYEAICW
jgi:hypothetical protein